MRVLVVTLSMAILGGCEAPELEAPRAPPPPISGGSLLVTADGRHAVAADADRDVVWIVDLGAGRVAHSVALAPGDEPGRLTEDLHGRVHVALRSGGAVASIEVASGALVAREPVCAAPRGVAYDAALDAIHVACLGGDLATLRAADLAPVSRVRIERDLRDVIVGDGGLLVSRFRSAELLAVDVGGTVTRRTLLPTFASEEEHTFAPSVAWRTLPLPDGGVLMVHQRGLIESVPLPEPHTPASDSSYGSTGAVPADPGIVHGAVSVIRPDDPPELPPGPVLPLATLPVDAAVSPDGTTAAIVAAGSGAVLLLDVAEIESGQATRRERIATRGQPIAAAFAPGGRLWVQTRRPASVQSPDGSSIALGDEPGTLGAYEAAHDLFHLTASDRGALACASCHPEGSDDGRTWSFTAFGAHAPQLRRTQALRGGLTTGPLHWDGALADFNALVQEVLVLRMGGAAPGEGRAAALETWLLATARFPLEPAADAGAALRGDVLFHDAEVGCAACHAGDKLTNDTTVDVGTGELLQVPTLVGISHRAPFMHDGCAPTLLDRFGPCGGGDAHGHTSQLSAAELADLVAYLETL